MGLRRYLTMFLVAGSLGANAQLDEEKVAEFVKNYADRHQVSQADVSAILSNAQFKQDIIDKIDKPAEGTMTWGKYRKIFIKEERINAGVEFWKNNEQVLAQVTADTGIPEEIILGIIGVETFYGQRIGSYRVIDALYTLAFGYPKRSSFFKSELEKFLEICDKQHLDIYSIKGSYAGAIGYCQFMPSSYLAFAKSYDNDNSANLMEVNDAIASVANYLAQHKWEAGNIIAAPVAFLDHENTTAVSKNSKPNNSLRFYRDHGFIPKGNITPDAKAALIEFENDEGKEYWFGFNNFYVITRYNHSPMYALAVYQLGQEVKKRYESSAP